MTPDDPMTLKRKYEAGMFQVKVAAGFATALSISIFLLAHWTTRSYEFSIAMMIPVWIAIFITMLNVMPDFDKDIKGGESKEGGE